MVEFLPMMKQNNIIWLKVAIAAPVSEPLSYTFPSGYEIHSPEEADTFIGRRVLVNLSGRKITGYVVGSEPAYAANFAVKAATSFQDEIPLFHANMVPFFQWVANYYCIPLGMAIKAALPAGLVSKSEKRLELLDEKAFIDVTAGYGEKEWLQELRAKHILSGALTQKVMKEPADRTLVKKLEGQNVVKISQYLVADKVKEKTETCYGFGKELAQVNGPLSSEETPGSDWIRPALAKSLKVIEKKTLSQIRHYTAENKTDSIAGKDLFKIYSGARKAVPLLVEKGLVVKSEQRIFRDPFGGQYIQRAIPENLTAEQQKAYAALTDAMDSNSFTPFLLHGVTASGKTEVYLRSAAHALAQGKDVLVLVPEIALATQLESHFIARFKDQVVLQHSGLTPGQKYDQWFNALCGKAKIVIGARSAVFAPLADIGLIIVDEEHDGAFKQDDSFRYNGRDLAVLRAKLNNSTVLLGSATPSVVSYYNAVQRKYRLLKMEKRAGSQSLPEVTIVDIRKTSSREKNRIFWPQLADAIVDNYEKGQQTVILLNRRGFSSVVICRECGKQVECKNCHVSLTLHKSINRLVCHYCNYSLTSQLVCENCRSDKLIPVGFGTERVEEEIQGLLPDAKVARLDSDSTRDKQKFLQTVHQMHQGEIDVMVGTQMIAKGHDFPGVTLVGVVYADSGLHMPDFRAAERTYQLISQVTGRAGRGEKKGRVIIQTMQPSHYAIQKAKAHDYEGFYQHEIELRQAPVYPPFIRMLAVHIDSTHRLDVENTGLALRKTLYETALEKDRELAKRLIILGPAPAPLDRLKDRYRYQLMIKSPSVDDLLWVGRTVLKLSSLCSHGKNTRVQVDMDPENMM